MSRRISCPLAPPYDTFPETEFYFVLHSNATLSGTIFTSALRREDRPQYETTRMGRRKSNASAARPEKSTRLSGNRRNSDVPVNAGGYQ